MRVESLDYRRCKWIPPGEKNRDVSSFVQYTVDCLHFLPCPQILPLWDNYILATFSKSTQGLRKVLYSSSTLIRKIYEEKSMVITLPSSVCPPYLPCRREMVLTAFNDMILANSFSSHKSGGRCSFYFDNMKH